MLYATNDTRSAHLCLSMNILQSNYEQRVAKLGTALTTDFCPWANRWVYWLKNPFWVLLAAVIVSAACAAFINPMIYAITVLLLIVVGTGTILPWLSIRGISCELLFDVRRVRFQEPALIRLQIRNRSWFPVWGLSLIEGFSTADASHAVTDGDDGIAFGRISGRSTMEYTWAFAAAHRGIYPVHESAMVETSFPFGLFRSQRRAKVNGRLIVWPETIELDGLPDSAEQESPDDEFSDRRVGEFGDMLGVRPFRMGDSLRRVHWAQTARQQTLIVTERQAPVTSVARVWLDLSASSHPLSTRAETVEQCVRTAASICDSLHAQGCRVELQVGNDLYVGDRRSGGLERVMDALATAAVNDATDARTATEDSGRGFGVMITTEHGFVSDGIRQIVVTSAGVDHPGQTEDILTRSESSVWFRFPADALLSDLQYLWKEQAVWNR